MSDRVTIKDVARRSGVSVAAASRALNDRPGVRLEVRDRVQLVANALGYRPNRSAQNLAGGKASMLGLVIHGSDIGSNAYAARLVESVAVAAEARDQGLALIVEADEPNEAVRALINHRQIDGVVVSVAAVDASFTAGLLENEFPTVLLGDDTAHPEASSVDVENRESTAQLVDHLITRGASRVAMLTGRMERSDSVERLEGFTIAHSRRGLTVDPALVVRGDATATKAYEVADRLFAERPEAIFCANDQSALGIYRRALEVGLRLPDQLSIAGFDGCFTGPFSQPRLTSVVQPFSRMAERAIDLLLDLVRGHATPGTKEVFTPTLFFGDTSR